MENKHILKLHRKFSREAIAQFKQNIAFGSQQVDSSEASAKLDYDILVVNIININTYLYLNGRNLMRSMPINEPMSK